MVVSLDFDGLSDVYWVSFQPVVQFCILVVKEEALGEVVYLGLFRGELRQLEDEA